MLRFVLNSFFHYNTYVLRELIILDYCDSQEFVIWDLLPQGAPEFKNIYFQVITNSAAKNQISAID